MSELQRRFAHDPLCPQSLPVPIAQKGGMPQMWNTTTLAQDQPALEKRQDPARRTGGYPPSAGRQRSVCNLCLPQLPGTHPGDRSVRQIHRTPEARSRRRPDPGQLHPPAGGKAPASKLQRHWLQILCGSLEARSSWALEPTPDPVSYEDLLLKNRESFDKTLNRALAHHALIISPRNSLPIPDIHSPASRCLMVAPRAR